jgi:PKD repeat protein
MTFKNIYFMNTSTRVAGSAKIFAGIFFLLFMQFTAWSQNNVQVGVGTTASPSYGPIYRLSATSTGNYSNYVYLYTSSELGIPNGAIINRIDWEAEALTGGLSGSNFFRIDMQNTTQTTISVTNTWASEVAGAKMVYSNSSYQIPAGGGWISHYLDSGFVYNGGNLKIATDHVKNGTATGAIDWYYETQTGLAGGVQGTTSRQTIAFSTTYSNRRPNIRIYYAVPGIDVAPSDVFSPVVMMTPGSTVSVGARFVNWAQDTITSMDLVYQMNNQTPVTEAWTGILPGGGTLNYTFTTGLTLPNTRPVDLRVWVENPNGLGPDNNPANDTLLLPLCMALDGNYTIGPDPSDDFATLNEAVDALQCGIVGPVVFLVKEGVYNEQIVLRAVQGASATNTITFRGEKQKSTVIEHSPTVSAQRAAIDFIGAKHYIIDSLTIDVSGGAYGWGVHFNTVSDSIIIRNNIIVTDITTTGTAYDGIVASNSATTNSTTGNTVHNLLIENNTITGGNHGIRLNGITATPLTGIVIRNNRVLNSYATGIYLLQVTAPVVEGNLVDIRGGSGGSTASEGILLSTVPGPFVISRNKIINAGQYGIYISNSSGVSGNPSKIVNNMIGGGFRNTSNLTSGIRLLGTASAPANYIDIYYNSINMDFGDGSALNLRATTGVNNIRVRNNSLAYTGTGIGYPLYIVNSTAGIVTALDFNNYFSTSPTKFVYYGTDRASLTALRSVNVPAGNDVNSIALNPGYASAYDLRLISPNLVGKGTPISGFTTDYFGAARSSTTPVIGAHEFVPVPNDVGVTVISNPKVACATSTAEQVTVTLYNYGTNSQTSIPMAYRVNGGTIVRQTLSTSLAANTSMQFTFTTTANLTAAGPYLIEVFPELTSDARRSNDTIKYVFYNGLSGQYTIGGSSPDYATINDAVNDLTLKGVCSAVTFLIRPGTYAERVVIPAILNASAANTITFRGENQTTSIISNATTVSANRAAIVLDGARYIIIDSLTINVAGSTYGWGVHLINDAQHNIIMNNRIFTSTTGTSANHAGIISSISLTGVTGGNSSHNINIEQNEIYGGYYGIGLYGLAASRLAGMVVKNNHVEDYHYYGIYLSQVAAPIVQGNTIIHRATGTEFGTALYLAGPGPFDISSNRIIGAGQNGIMITTSNISGGVRSLLSNNMVGGGFKSVSDLASGIRILSSSEINVYHNTVNMDGLLGAALYVVSSATLLDVRNNSFTYSGQDAGLAMHVDNPASLSQNDYNNYYSTGTAFVFYGSALADLAALQAVNIPVGNDVNSHQLNPYYVSNTDLRITRINLNGKGTPLSAVPADIFGTTRSVTAPAIGAHEFIPLSLDAGISLLVAPVSGCGLSNTDTVKIEVINYGSTTLSSIPVAYRMNGGTVVNETFTGSLTINALGNYTFNAAVPLNGVGPFNFEIWTNLTGDMLKTNDTIRVTVYKTLNGTYTIGGTGSDFNTLTEGVNLLNLIGACGPTTFKLRPGVYNERIIIRAFAGNSSTNTFTLEGSGASTVIFAPATTVSADRPAITIQGAQYVTLDSLTINVAPVGTGTSYATGILVMNGSHHTVIRNNVIIGDTLTTSSNYGGIIVSNSATSSSTYTDVHDILIENNHITGGYYGITLYGNATPTRPTGYMQGLVIRNNKVMKSQYHAISPYYTYSPVIERNEINMRTVSASTTNYGIYLYNVYGPFRLSRNKLNNVAVYGVFIYYATNPTTTPSYIDNNMIGGVYNGTNSQASGLRLSGSASEPCQNIRIVHNSVVNDGPVGYAFQLSTAGLIDIDIINNIFAYKGKKTGSAMNIVANAVPGIRTMDYNNYYSNGVNFATYNSVAVSNLADLRAINIPAGHDSNSMSINPPFVSNTDLRVVSPDFYAKGKAAPDVPVDFFGYPRHSLTPTIGAHEFLPLDNDIAIVQILSPGTFDCGDSLHSVTVVVKNVGLNTQTSIPVHFDITGSTTASFTEYVAGPLSFGETDTFTFVNTINFAGGGMISLSAYSDLAGDDDHTNDSVKIESVLSIRSNTPVVFADTVCVKDTAVLVATATGGTRLWFEEAAGGLPVSIGDTIKINGLKGDTSLYVENINITPDRYHVGPPDTSIGTKTTAFFSDAEIFTAYRNVYIDSVKLITDVAGTITIGLRDASNTLIASKQITLTVGNRNYHLGFYVPQGVDYKLTMLSGTTGVLLWRNTMGATYPYEIPGMISITGTTYTSQDRYYFFYDLQVNTYCPSDRVEVNAVAAKLPVASNIVPGDIFDGTYKAGGVENIDHVCAGDTLIYDLKSPAIYSNNNYGTQWSISQFSVKSINGSNASNVQFTVPASGKDAAVTVIPSITEGDSIFILSVTYSQAKGCDTTLLRYIYVSPKPVASFTAQNVCAGNAVSFVNTSLTAGHTNISYSWNFGDGNTSSQKDPVHLYAAAGDYDVMLIASSVGGCPDTSKMTIQVYALPVADFKVAGSCSDQAFQFTDSSVITTGASFKWYFGDGDSSTAQSASHQYPVAGIYNAVLWVTQNGCSDSASKLVTVLPAPVVSFIKNDACVGEAIQFNNQSSVSSGTLSYKWEFGNGDTSVAQNPLYAYAASGNYQVKLTATASSGCSGSSTLQVTVHALPANGFSLIYQNDGEVNYTAAATAQHSYIWDFGDGNMGSGQNIVHKYQSAGSYQVKLVVTSPQGCSDSSVQSVQVLNVSVDPVTERGNGLTVYPNPYKDAATVVYSIGAASEVSLGVYDLSGRLVQNVYSGRQVAGKYEFVLNGDSPAGVYIIKLIAGEQMHVRRIVKID